MRPFLPPPPSVRRSRKVSPPGQLTIIVPYPAGGPTDVLVKAFENEEAKKVLATLGMTAAIKSPAELGAMIPAEIQKWAGVIKAANVTTE